MPELIDKLSRHVIDYRLGWRWLLDLKRGDTLWLSGFAPSEVSFLKDVFSYCTFTDDAKSASHWMVSEFNRSGSCEIPSHVNQIAVVGGRGVYQRWSSLRKWGSWQSYTMVPRGCPRVVIPTNNAREMAEGLALYSPGRMFLRWIVAILQYLARFGLRPSCGGQSLLVARRDRSAPPSRSFALYLGNPDPCRKTLILPIEARDEPRSIIKYAENGVAQKALETERIALNTLNASCIARFVPKLLDSQSTVSGQLLQIEYRKRRWIPQSRLQAEAMAFLGKLSTIGRSSRTLKSVLDEIQVAPRSAPVDLPMDRQIEIQQKLDSLVPSGFTVCGHRSHGDFAPWNCSWTRKGFFVFDWEASADWAPALGDAFYFAVAPFLHIHGSMSAGRAKERAFRNALNLKEAYEIGAEQIRVYWLLWLYQISYQKDFPNEWIQ